MIITFIGHSFISYSSDIKARVKKSIEESIGNVGAVSCYLGGYGEFDSICAEACKELKREGKDIQLIFITPYINMSKQKAEEISVYDAVIYPPIESTPPRFAISKRNEWMIKSADLIIAYVSHSYGGAYKSFLSAIRHGKQIINLSPHSTHRYG